MKCLSLILLASFLGGLVTAAHAVERSCSSQLVIIYGPFSNLDKALASKLKDRLTRRYEGPWGYEMTRSAPFSKDEAKERACRVSAEARLDDYIANPKKTFDKLRKICESYSSNTVLLMGRIESYAERDGISSNRVVKFFHTASPMEGTFYECKYGRNEYHTERFDDWEPGGWDPNQPIINPGSLGGRDCSSPGSCKT